MIIIKQTWSNFYLTATHTLTKPHFSIFTPLVHLELFGERHIFQTPEYR